MSSPEARFGFGDIVKYKDVGCVVAFERTAGDKQFLNLTALLRVPVPLSNIDADNVTLVKKASPFVTSLKRFAPQE